MTTAPIDDNYDEFAGPGPAIDAETILAFTQGHYDRLEDRRAIDEAVYFAVEYGNSRRAIAAVCSVSPNRVKSIHAAVQTRRARDEDYSVSLKALEDALVDSTVTPRR